ncbi:MAG: hypothetical protein ACRD3Q_17830 [Terriglobales bacterium]
MANCITKHNGCQCFVGYNRASAVFNMDNNTRGLILGPTNGLALTSKINEFIARRIPIVVVQTDAPIPTGPYMTSVEPDQAQVSNLGAQRILSTIGSGYP